MAGRIQTAEEVEQIQREFGPAAVFDIMPPVCEGDYYTVRIGLPSKFFDLWGWKEPQEEKR